MNTNSGIPFHLSPGVDLGFRFVALIAIFWCSSVRLCAEPYFALTSEIEQAYHLALSLRLDEAQILLTKVRQQEPENHLTYFFEDYIDFFKIFLSEDETMYKRLMPNRNARLSKIQSGDPSSPYFLLTQAEIHLHWALLKVKFEENFSAALEINRAFRLLKKNERRHPDFVPNLKALGVLRAGVGTIPDKYRWLVRLVTSLSGTVEEGVADLERVLDYSKANDFLMQKETAFMYVIVLNHFKNDTEAAWQFLQTQDFHPGESPLECFMLANIAMKTGRNDQAIQLLSGRPRGNAYFPFHYMDFMLGIAKLRRLDRDADVPLLRFVGHFDGEHYIKEAYQKLAWHALINNRAEEYGTFLRKSLSQGAAAADGDKQALREAKNGQAPHKEILQARLLFDGGYHAKSLEKLASVESGQIEDQEHRIEHIYRTARALQMQGNLNEALAIYDQTIEAGGNLPYYYACNAALQKGIIYESRGEQAAAKAAFKQCLKFSPDDYSDGLHSKAKAGLSRLE